MDANGDFMDFDGADAAGRPGRHDAGDARQGADGSVQKRYYVNVYPALTVSGSLGPAGRRRLSAAAGRDSLPRLAHARVSRSARARTASTARRSRSARATRRSRRRAGSRSARRTRTASARTRSARCCTRASVGDPSTSANEADVRVDAIRDRRAQAGHARRLHGRAQRRAARADHRPLQRPGAGRAGDRPARTPSASRCRARPRAAPRPAGAARSRRPSTRSCPAPWSRASARSGSSARSTSSTRGPDGQAATGERQHAVRAPGRLRSLIAA